MLKNICMTQYFTPFTIRMLLVKAYLIPTLLYGSEQDIFLDVVDIVVSRIFSTKSTICHWKVLKCRMLIFLHVIIYVGEPNYLFSRLKFSRTNRGYRINAISTGNEYLRGTFLLMLFDLGTNFLIFLIFSTYTSITDICTNITKKFKNNDNF